MAENNMSKKSGWALGLTIVGYFIPFLGIVTVIIGLVLAHKVRKLDKDNGIALAALIIGYIYVAFAILFALLILIIGAQTFFATYQALK